MARSLVKYPFCKSIRFEDSCLCGSLHDIEHSGHKKFFEHLIKGTYKPVAPGCRSACKTMSMLGSCHNLLAMPRHLRGMSSKYGAL